MKPVLSLSKVWKTYVMGTVQIHALRGLDLDIYPGEFVSIMGPSGSGKSTSMNMIGSLDIPSKGKVELEGVDISRLTESDLATIRGKKIGFIFQQFNLIKTLTAKENVMLPMIFQGVPVHKREKAAEELLVKVGLSDRMNNRPTEMSGGQQQRVAIARALANDPEIILADEPTGNLDSVTADIIIEFLHKLNSEGKTIIMVTHDEETAKVASRIEYLKDGTVIKSIKKRKQGAKT